MSDTAYYYQGDRKPWLATTLTRDGAAIDLTGYTGIAFKMYRKGREAYEAPVVSGAATNLGPANEGGVEYQWAADDLTDLYGNFSGVFVITDADGAESIPDGAYIDIVVRPAAT